MCGIFGIWERSGAPVDRALLARGTRALRHRGPDDEGYLLARTRTAETVAARGPDTVPELALPTLQDAMPGATPGDLALGFRRLAILDLSPAGHQPMASASGRFWLVFNGEIYNHVELRAELAGRGHAFKTRTDTEVILA